MRTARPRGSKQARDQHARLQTGAGKVIGYVRVSTAGQAINGHSLDGQRRRLQEVAEREGLLVTDIVEEVESGAKEREALAEVQRRILAGEAQGILFPKVDRLGRSLLHLLKIVEWAVSNRVDLISADEGWQVKAGEKVDRMLPFRLAMAEVELERIRERTREGLKAARQKGIRLGRPVENTGELAERAVAMRRQGMTLQSIADTFNGEGTTTARGKQWSATTVYDMINRVDPKANPVGGYRGRRGAAA
jgi:DNA invertase Pin-like site-specific DNA recombinase